MARILIIDDDSLLARAISRILEGRNHAVKVANNGVDGFNGVRASKPDLVLTDISMPHGGFPAIAALRKEFPHLPIIAMSGNHDRLPDALGLGAASVLPKPFSPEELVSSVEAALAASLHRASSAPRSGHRLKPSLPQRPKPAVVSVASR